MKSFAVLFAAVLWTSTAPAGEPPMITRTYPVMSGIADLFYLEAGQADTNRDDAAVAADVDGARSPEQEGLRKFFERQGVPFPPGSSIFYNSDVFQIIMRNTPENTDIFERILPALNVVPLQVEIDVAFVEFDLKLIEELARKSARAAPTGEEIKALWREGGGRIIGTSKIVTRSGVNAQTKGGDEVIYRTGFKGIVNTNESAVTMSAGQAGFETRETGVICNVTPTVGPDGYTVDLTMAPELCEFLDWDDAGIGITGPEGKTTKTNVRVPRFHSRQLTTSIVLWDGETVVVGAMLNSDGAKVTYAFATIRLLDPAAHPVRISARTGFIDLSPALEPAGAPNP